MPPVGFDSITIVPVVRQIPSAARDSVIPVLEPIDSLSNLVISCFAQGGRCNSRRKANAPSRICDYG